MSENVDDLMTFIGNIIGRGQALQITRIWLCDTIIAPSKRMFVFAELTLTLRQNVFLGNYQKCIFCFVMILPSSACGWSGGFS